MHISLRTLKYVVGAADHGNLTHAARELNVTQPSISSAIAQFEDVIGVQLFVRQHARGVTLTQAGAKVVNEARLLLNHAVEFESNARSLNSNVQGEISVGSFVNIANRYMPQLLKDFATSYPAVRVNLIEGPHSTIVDELVSGHVEIAFCFDYALPDEAERTEIAILPPHALLSKDHPLASRSEIDLEELKDDPYILLDLEYSREYFLGLFRAIDHTPRIAFRTQSYELIRGLVGQGFGYTIHNSVSRSTETYDGNQIVAIPLRTKLPPVRLMCLKLRGHNLRPSVRTFLKSAVKSLSAETAILATADAQSGKDLVWES